MTIRKGVSSELSTIKLLTEACASAMSEKGIYQWNEHYPSFERLKKDIELEELYILEDHYDLRGIVVITETRDKEYLPVKWLTGEFSANLYIHRLAVHPDFWGNGYAQKLMDFAENFAREKKYDSIRLDTFSQNKRNQKFYESRGYQRLGNIYFPRQSIEPFYCYELLL